MATDDLGAPEEVNPPMTEGLTPQQFARELAEFYRGLLAEKLPEDLAKNLTIAFLQSNMFASRYVGPPVNG